MSDQPPTIYAVTGYIGPSLMRGEWSSRREDCNHPCAEYVLKSTTDTRLADAEAMAEALRLALDYVEGCKVNNLPDLGAASQLPFMDDVLRIGDAVLAKWRAGSDVLVSI